MNVIFRCDASPGIGLGHLSRSLALAEGLRRAGETVRFLGQWSDAAKGLLAASGFPSDVFAGPAGTRVDALCLAKLALASGAGVVVDSYSVDATWLGQLAQPGIKVTLIDDFAELDDYSGCVGVLNLTVGANEENYLGLAPGAFAGGPGFFLARENIIALRAQRREPSPARRRVLVALGGEDKLGMTVPLYREIKRSFPGIEVRVLTAQGPALARRENLPAADFPALAGDLAGHYAWADCCVSGGGLTKYECAYLALPVAIFSQTPAQQAETANFCALGLATDLLGGGERDPWQARLADFLHVGPRQGKTVSRARQIFPADSTDRAAKRVQQWLTASPVLVAP